MYRHFSFLLACSLFSLSAYAGNYPFPQNVKYVYGIKPTNAKHSDALNSYNSWKYIYVVNAGAGKKRVLFEDGASTVSEGIAYGMLLAAYADDQIVFDGLWNYYKSYMNGNGVMNWKINSNGSIAGYGGATDAEEDAAMALIIADNQWGSAGPINYMSDALTLINNIMLHQVEKPSYVLKPGDAWGGSGVTNPSYFAPAYYRIFYILTGDTQWLTVITKSYQILALNSSATTGLASDWCNSAGNPVSGFGSNHFYDASRYPWRMATDYLWFGTAQAKTYCTRMANFIRNTVGGSKNIVDGYTRSGTKIGSSHNSTFIGTFAVTAMVDASFQTHLNSSYDDNVKTVPDGYFSQMLHTISLFMLTGNFYRLPQPVCAQPDLGADLSLCVTPSYTLDPGLPTGGRSYLWNTGATSPTITEIKKGTYIVVIDSAGCVRTDTINLLGLEINLGSNIDINVLDDVTLSAGSLGAGVAYLWNTGELTESITIDKEGTYFVQVDSAGCTDRDTITLSYEVTDSIAMYPNPSNGKFKILLYNADAKKVDITIYNTEGQFIAKKNYSNIITGEFLEMDFSSLSKGIYLIKIETENNIQVKKFIIQ